MATDFSISTFTSKFTSGGARPNLFQITLSPPTGVTSTGSANIKYHCRAAQIPSSTVQTYEVPYFGRNVKHAGDREFTEFTTTFINDEAFQMRTIFDNWMHKLNQHRDNKPGVNLGSRTSYTSTVTLETFKKVGTLDQKWEFKGCWPSGISDIPLSWDTTNAIQEFTVTWQYDFFTHDLKATTASSSTD